MTEHERVDYIKRWQYNKDHLFLLPHDDRTIKSYIKDRDVDAKSVIVTALAFVVVSTVFGVLFGLFSGEMLSCIKGSFTFVAVVCGMMCVCNFALYINYVNDGESTTYGTGMWALLCVAMWYLFEKKIYMLDRKYGIIAAVALLISSLYIVVWLIKKVFYEKENDLDKALMDRDNGRTEAE